MDWLPMKTAPKTGKRILIKTVTFGWNSRICEHVATGNKAVEAWWSTDMSGKKRWLEWCGNAETWTTGRLEPLGWLPLPEPRPC